MKYKISYQKMGNKKPKIPANCEVEQIFSDDCHLIGYFCKGHWDKQSVAIATNKEYALASEDTFVKVSDFRYGYMRKVPGGEYVGSRLIVCDRGRGAFPVTYSWD